MFFGIDTALEQKGPERENALKILTKKRLFIAKHYDFLIVDLAALILGYWLSLAFRRSLDITLRNQNLLWTYGIAALLSFLLVEILTENLNGIITRGLVREVQAVALQMTLTWTVYLSALFLMHNIFALSRILTIVTYIICSVFLLLFRNGWKMICKFSRVSDSVMPELLIVCEASHAQRVLNRLVSGALSKQYDICGLIVNEKSELNYKDWYPCETGLDRIDAFTGERRIQYAYVELNDRKEEQETIDKLLETDKTDSISAMRDFNELAAKNKVNINPAPVGRGAAMGGFGAMGGAAAGAAAPAARNSGTSTIRRIQEKFPKEYAEVQKLRQDDPETYRAEMRKLAKKLTEEEEK